MAAPYIAISNLLLLGNGEYFVLEVRKNNSPIFTNKNHVLISKEAAKDGSFGWVICVSNQPIYGIFGDVQLPPADTWAAFDPKYGPPPKITMLNIPTGLNMVGSSSNNFEGEEMISV